MILAGSVCLSANLQVAAAEQSQYNMSLQDKVVTDHNRLSLMS
jgi:hypothetical protein